MAMLAFSHVQPEGLFSHLKLSVASKLFVHTKRKVVSPRGAKWKGPIDKFV